MDETSSSDAYKTAQIGRFDQNGAWQAEGNAAVATTAPSTTTPATTARATTAPRSTTTMAQASPTTHADNATGTSGNRARRRLPRTESPLPLYELLGGLSLAGGLVVRRIRKA